MGEVYLAEDTILGRNVALKILPADLAFDPKRMRRFVEEAKAASAINHPNIAAIYELGDAGGLHFIVMEYVQGEVLSAKIANRDLRTSEIVDIGRQIADALEAAHAKGITVKLNEPCTFGGHHRLCVKLFRFLSSPSTAMNTNAA
jgi:serine/threonine protein kinase